MHTTLATLITFTTLAAGSSNVANAAIHPIDLGHTVEVVESSVVAPSFVADVPIVEARVRPPIYRPPNVRRSYRQQYRGNFRRPFSRPKFIPYRHRAPNVKRFYESRKKRMDRIRNHFRNYRPGPSIRRYRGR